VKSTRSAIHGMPRLRSTSGCSSRIGLASRAQLSAASRGRQQDDDGNKHQSVQIQVTHVGPDLAYWTLVAPPEP
jgi:hypothetical protein